MKSIKTRFVPIGNSRGLRIPKVVIDQLGLGGDVEICIEADRLVIQPLTRPRAGWDEAFQAMAAMKDDTLLDLGPATEWESTEWEW